MPEIRRDPISGEWISLSGDRQTRPLTVSGHLLACPFCPGPTTEVGLHAFQTAVFDNRFPAFDRPGASEIVVYSPDHWADLSTLSRDHLGAVWSAWHHRTQALGGRPDVAQVFIFENRGTKVGASIAHPHGQIYGYPFVPPRMQREGETWPDPCPLCRDDSPKLVERTLLATPDWRLVAPWAARMPFQLTLYPRAHHSDITTVDYQSGRDAMGILQVVYALYDRWFGHKTALVMALYQAPSHLFGRERYHLRFDCLPIERGPEKIKYLAGSELAMGAFVGDMLPEQVAASLRPLMQTAKGEL